MRRAIIAAIGFPALLLAQGDLRLKPGQPFASAPLGSTQRLSFRIEPENVALPRIEALRNGEPINLPLTIDGPDISLDYPCTQESVSLVSIQTSDPSGAAVRSGDSVVFCGSPAQELFTGEYQLTIADDFEHGRATYLHHLKLPDATFRILGLPAGAQDVLAPNSLVSFSGYRSGNAIILADPLGALPTLPQLGGGFPQSGVSRKLVNPSQAG